MIRRRIVRVLVGREFRRLKKNPTALLMLGFLLTLSLVIAVMKPRASAPEPLEVWIIYTEPAAWIEHLAENRPEEPEVRLVARADLAVFGGSLQIPKGVCLADIRNGPNQTPITILGRYTGTDSSRMQPFWDWFWPTVTGFYASESRFQQKLIPLRPQNVSPRSGSASLTGDLFRAEFLASVLLFIVQFFCCGQLLVASVSQDRERGSLAALVLSPARISEILLARFLFHLALSLAGAVGIAGILAPAALTHLLFWTALLATSLGFLSVAVCITAVCRTQTTASLLLMGYMVGGGIFYFLSLQSAVVAPLTRFAFESYSLPLLYISLKTSLPLAETPGLLRLGLLIGLWLAAAYRCFGRFGWQT